MSDSSVITHAVLLSHLQFHVGDVAFAWVPLNVVECLECCLQILDFLHLHRTALISLPESTVQVWRAPDGI